MEQIDTFEFEKRALLLEAWVEKRRQIAALEAEAAALLGERLAVLDAEVAEAPMHRDAIWRSTMAEYASAGRISKGSVEYAFVDALHLRDFPAVAASFAAGQVSAAHVREVVRAADVVREAILNIVVSAESLGLYEQAVLVVAEKDSPARTRAHARQVAATLTQQSVRERHERAAGERAVTIRSVGDGLALLTAVLPEYLAVAIHDRLTQLARGVVSGRGKPGDNSTSPAFPRESAGARGSDAAHGSEAAHGSDAARADSDGPDAARADSRGPNAARADSRGPEAARADAAWWRMLTEDLRAADADAHAAGAPTDEDDFRLLDDPAVRGFLDAQAARAQESRQCSFHRDSPLDELSFDDSSFDDASFDEASSGNTSISGGASIFGDDTFTTDPFTTDPFTTDPLTTDPRAVDTRTLDQVRADLFADLLLVSDPSAAHGDGLDGITGRIQVTVAASTLAGADDRLAELDGHGPLHPDIARDLAGRNGGWTRLFLDPGGQVTATDTYTPTEPMRRFLRARDEHCRFFGCMAPATRCDIDHQHDHALGGATANDNLAHLCRAHHMLKHPDIPDGHRWSATQGPDGTITWHSPLGRTYDDSAPPRVMFV